MRVESEDGDWKRGGFGIQRFPRRKRFQFKFYGDGIIDKTQRRAGIFAGHLDLGDARPIGTAGGLEKFGGVTAFDGKIKWNFAFAKVVPELPGSELAIGANFKIARADAAKVHSGVGMNV